MLSTTSQVPQLRINLANIPRATSCTHILRVRFLHHHTVFLCAAPLCSSSLATTSIPIIQKILYVRESTSTYTTSVSICACMVLAWICVVHAHRIRFMLLGSITLVCSIFFFDVLFVAVELVSCSFIRICVAVTPHLVKTFPGFPSLSHFASQTTMKLSPLHFYPCSVPCSDFLRVVAIAAAAWNPLYIAVQYFPIYPHTTKILFTLFPFIFQFRA